MPEIDTFTCSYCMEFTEAEDYPNECPACHVGRCKGCSTLLKAKSKFCHGCAAIPPIVEATFHRVGNFSASYAEIDWCKAGLRGPHLLTISGGYHEWPSTLITHRVIEFPSNDGPTEKFRILTPAEHIVMGYPTDKCVCSERSWVWTH